MNTRSVSWRLPLTYAGIALLTATCLGVVLLATLRQYYGRSEEQHLTLNAAAIGSSVSAAIESDATAGSLASMLRAIASLAQTRVRYYNSSGTLLIDSGAQGDGTVYYISVPVAQSAVSANESPVGLGAQVVTIVMDERSEADQRLSEAAVGPVGIGITIPAASTSYGLLFGRATEPFTRSAASVSVPVVGQAGDVVGYIELSDAPAYGLETLKEVATYWAVASLVAVLAAAAVGWLVSRRMTAPLLALTRAATSMAAGNLSARATVVQRDEFGELGAAFNDMAGRVEETVASLRRFVADAAHELHTPLTALRTYLELLGQSGAQADVAVVAAQSLEQVERLQRLTAGLMDLSRLEGGSGLEGAAPVDVAALVSAACEHHAARAEQAGLSLRVNAVHAPLIVRARAADVERALGNLVDNAIKFGRDGGELSVSVRNEGPWAVLAVSDHGIGIPADEMPFLFGRFHRARNASAYPGNGLGLAIVKAVAVEYGGSVEATSGGGVTTFTMRLPLLFPPLSHN